MRWFLIANSIGLASALVEYFASRPLVAGLLLLAAPAPALVLWLSGFADDSIWRADQNLDTVMYVILACYLPPALVRLSIWAARWKPAN